MFEIISKWIRKVSNEFVHSIAFFPAVISVLFLLLAVVALELDVQGVGDFLNREVKWLTLRDASTARTIVATVAAAMISVTVFSFSMVMVVMNQTASQMSNRMLDIIIGNSTQKVVLGFYIGTIVYSLFILSNIREIDDHTSIPSLSIYLALLITIFDMFLFAYYIHHVTQYFKHEQLIQAIHVKTCKAVRKFYQHSTPPDKAITGAGMQILSNRSGYFQRFGTDRLLKVCKENDLVVSFLRKPGEYVVKGDPLYEVISDDGLKPNVEKAITLAVDFFYGQEIDKNPFYGYKHLMEVAIKALSPGINDPGTAILSIHALTDLLVDAAGRPDKLHFADDKGAVRIVLPVYSFEDLLNLTIKPIRDYGRKDRQIREALHKMIDVLSRHVPKQRRQQVEQLRTILDPIEAAS